MTIVYRLRYILCSNFILLDSVCNKSFRFKEWRVRMLCRFFQIFGTNVEPLPHTSEAK